MIRRKVRTALGINSWGFLSDKKTVHSPKWTAVKKIKEMN